MYIAKFNSRGSCMEIYEDRMFPEVKSEMLANGYVEISESEHDFYVGNKGMGDNGTGYVRDMTTGKPVSAPPAPAPSIEQRADQLSADYETARFALSKYYVEAFLNGDVSAQKEIKAELDNLKAQFNESLVAMISEVE